eukprot:gnl/TRDRNA2_/TRDRNA2_174059_c1_seq6.p1 gnl/TRDRNA2_/TRDRNA2_174059_c1~~gnl/TRDRNA2_/TRDRNA2_174059_c1_seq6.p1  ORF type:complete len:119 (-),score=15.50 gnl/TRDRNA2_/TRDRNA2_174059_c1_seq6:71-427(-)
MDVLQQVSGICKRHQVRASLPPGKDDEMLSDSARPETSRENRRKNKSETLKYMADTILRCQIRFVKIQPSPELQTTGSAIDAHVMASQPARRNWCSRGIARVHRLMRAGLGHKGHWTE